MLQADPFQRFHFVNGECVDIAINNSRLVLSKASNYFIIYNIAPWRGGVTLRTLTNKNTKVVGKRHQHDWPGPMFP